MIGKYRENIYICYQVIFYRDQYTNALTEQYEPDKACTVQTISTISDFHFLTVK